MMTGLGRGIGGVGRRSVGVCWVPLVHELGVELRDGARVSYELWSFIRL